MVVLFDLAKPQKLCLCFVLVCSRGYYAPILIKTHFAIKYFFHLIIEVKTMECHFIRWRQYKPYRINNMKYQVIFVHEKVFVFTKDKIHSRKKIKISVPIGVSHLLDNRDMICIFGIVDMRFAIFGIFWNSLIDCYLTNLLELYWKFHHDKSQSIR